MNIIYTLHKGREEDLIIQFILQQKVQMRINKGIRNYVYL